MVKHLRFSLLLIVCIALLSACSTNGGDNTTPSEPTQEPNEKGPTVNINETKDPTEGGTLSVGVLQLPAWNPFKWREANATFSTAERLVYRGLFTYSHDQQLIPDLIDAYSIEEKDNGVSVLTFTLDEQAQWHDGTPVTFEDLAFTYQTYLNPFYYGAWKQNLSYINGTSAFRSGRADTISGIQQNEAGQITIEMTDATSSFYHALTAPLLPAHQLKDMSLSAIHEQMLEGSVIGNGEFKLEGKSDTTLQLVRAQSFATGGPYLDGITFEVMRGNSTTDYKSYDLLEVPPLVDEVDNGYKAFDVNQNVFYYLGFNVQDTNLSNKEIRTAIVEAMDRKAILDAILNGQGAIVDRIVTDSSWLAADQERDIEAANIESAKNRLAAQGVTTDKPLTITIHYQGDHPLISALVENIRVQLAGVNVQVEKKPLSGDEFYAYVFSGKDIQAFIHAWPFVKDIGYWWKLYGGYHDVKDLGLNILRYHNSTADELLKKLYYAAPSEEQKETAQAFLDQLHSDRVMLPLLVPAQRYWISDKLHDVRINGDGWFTDITKWWMEK